MEELKPCPFCGGKAQLITIGSGGLWDHNAVECEKCNIRVFAQDPEEEEPVIECWNKRAFRIGRWKKVEGNYITPGGTPWFECAQCGGGQHLYGVEYPKRVLVCPKCGSINLYSWEKVRWLEDEQ